MSDFLPPLIAEIRANAAQFYREVGKVGASVKKLERETEGGLSPAKKSFHTLAGVGKAAALGLAGAAAVVGYESLKMATTFQSKVELLHTAAGESQANLKMIASGIMSLATATGTSTSQLADGMYIAEKAGYRLANGGLNVLRAAAEGAKAENVDLGTAMNALTSVMQSYGAKAGDAVSVENELVRGSGLAKTTMQEYAGALSTVVPLAAKLGVQFPELAGAIATMTQHGTSAQEATHELDNALRSLSAPNSVAVSAMNQLGLSSVKVAQTLGRGPNGLQNAISMVVDAIQKHMGPAGLVVTSAFKQSSAATADLRSMISSMSPQLAKLSQGFLSGNVSLTEYRKATRGMGADGYAMGAQFMALAAKAHGFNDMVKAGNPAAVTFAQYLKQMMGGATGLNTALMLTGNSQHYFTSATNQVIAASHHAGKNIETWAATSKTAKVQFDQMRQGIDVLGIKIGTWLIPKVEELVHALTVTVGWLEKHKTVALVLAGAIGGVLVLAIGAWAVSMWAAMTAALGLEGSLLPIILIAAAIGVAVLLLATHWKQAWNWIKEAAAAVWNDFLKPMFDGIKTAVMDVVGFVESHWKILAGAFALILGPIGIIGVAIALLATHWRQVWGFIQKATEAVWNDGIKPIFHAIEWIAIKPLEYAVQGFVALWRLQFDLVRAIVFGAWNDVIRPVFSFIQSYAIDPIIKALQFFGQVWSAIWGGVQTVIQDVWNVIKSIVGGIESAIHGVSGAIHTVSHIAHMGGDLNPLNWDTGGPVPGAVGQPVAGIVHGGEYVLSNEMLNGQAPIDAGVIGAVLVNSQKYASQLSGLTNGTNPATALNGLAKAPSAALAAPAALGGGDVTLHHTTVVTLDGKVLQESVETHQLRQGLRRGGSHTYQQFSKGR